MMRSMYSGVSGLRAHQLKMDTIGNNIANVNTVGFKSQRVTFQEVFNQTLRGAGSAQAGKGGTNPQQVGLGISIASIDTFQVRGAVQRTDNNTDLAINGDGFFMLSNDAAGLNRSYTRAGNFSLDEAGNFVAANGYKVMGYMMDDTTGILSSNLTGVKISKADAVAAKESTTGTLEGNLDNNLTQINGGTVAVPIFAAGAGVTADTLSFTAGTKYWETTSTFYDSLGSQHNLKLTYVKGLLQDGATVGTSSDWAVYIQSMDTGKYLNTTTGVGYAANAGDAATGLAFKADGSLNLAGANTMNTGTTNAGKISIQIPVTNGASPINVKLDMTKLTQFANESSAAVTLKDGYPQGSLDTFSIGPTGEINGIFTNGQSKIIAQIALAAFKNPSGLEKTSENMFSATPNTGEPIIGTPGSSGTGSLNPGTLEMSNVDLSREFSEMISTQRGFQANSRIITTSDEMLQEMVNLKR